MGCNWEDLSWQGSIHFPHLRTEITEVFFPGDHTYLEVDRGPSFASKDFQQIQRAPWVFSALTASWEHSPSLMHNWTMGLPKKSWGKKKRAPMFKRFWCGLTGGWSWTDVAVTQDIFRNLGIPKQQGFFGILDKRLWWFAELEIWRNAQTASWFVGGSKNYSDKSNSKLLSKVLQLDFVDPGLILFIASSTFLFIDLPGAWQQLGYLKRAATLLMAPVRDSFLLESALAQVARFRQTASSEFGHLDHRPDHWKESTWN